MTMSSHHTALPWMAWVYLPPGDRRQKRRLRCTQKEMSGSSARNCGSAMNELGRFVSLSRSGTISHELSTGISMPTCLALLGAGIGDTAPLAEAARR